MIDIKKFDSRLDVSMYRAKAQMARNEGKYAEAAIWENKLMVLYEKEKTKES